MLPADLDPEIVEEVCLVVSELVTNAVLHAGTQVRAAVLFEPGSGRIRVEVSDQSVSAASPRQYSEESGTGRGLVLVKALSRRWGVDLAGSHTGKTVWAELRTGGAGPPGSGSGDNAPAPLEPDPAADPPTGAAPTGAAPEELIRVELRSLPVPVYLKAAEHSDELQREFALILERDPSEGSEPPGRLLSIIKELNGRFGSFGAGARSALEQAVTEGRTEVDLVYVAPAEVVSAVDHLARLFDGADSYCRAGDLLTLATPPQALAFRRWFFDQFRSQAEGAAPVSWPDWIAGHGSPRQA